MWTTSKYILTKADKSGVPKPAGSGGEGLQLLYLVVSLQLGEVLLVSGAAAVSVSSTVSAHRILCGYHDGKRHHAGYSDQNDGLVHIDRNGRVLKWIRLQWQVTLKTRTVPLLYRIVHFSSNITSWDWRKTALGKISFPTLHCVTAQDGLTSG